ncbi:dihydrodipicolinate synthase family protein [Devosia sp. 63-57]|uniref:dihydrodipicolinate synthase family protein n=1 Tax=Devosia sp. 63-57 TaxID=1895751 RepID=UPI00086ECD82|nr:dihydrodipicolinate synthase family protein [Devosia sp. 63-57]ODT50988.1 MAG: dihydrodipicolinate synthase family protein [Pelagibacterium sp. SCN 63-126]ODU85524.1 MAG: dihydrodipicolinate synthase family protein [Pelagibacterium sp. SCN 63-17]OJX44353.1 MAG: dihydrodipicolinate synthase family protein [Devosia sp. 63-57]
MSALSTIKGVLPALVTPFDENENFDEGRMRAIVDFLIGRGVDGLYVTGSTGEAFMMSPDERKRVLEVVTDEVKGRVPVIAHIGAISTHLSIDLARHAEKVGADALSSVPPFYWGFSQDQVVSYYTDITASTGLPMCAYNVPLAGLFGFDMIKRLAEIPGVEGIKYTAPTHHDIMRIKAEIGSDFVIYSGADEMAMSGLAFGADGIIGSFYNAIPEIYLALYAAVKAGDMAKAKALQEVGNAIIFFTLPRSPIAAIKRAMAWQGADAGYCRKPFGNFYSAAEEESLKAEFRAFKAERGLTGVNFLDAI